MMRKVAAIIGKDDERGAPVTAEASMGKRETDEAGPANPMAALSAAVLEGEHELHRLEGERRRCLSVVACADRFDAGIAELRQRRTGVVAAAFIDGDGEADTKTIDDEIAAAESAATQARTDGAAAKAGLELIDTRTAALRAAIERDRGELRGFVRADLVARREMAIQEFNASVDALRAPLQRLVAIQASLDEVLGQASAFHKSGGVTGSLISALNDEGLKKVNARGDLAVPSWLCPATQSLNAEVSAALHELVEMGLTTR
jgi:hypothetical protein